MQNTRLEHFFPNLQASGYCVTSPPATNYNCIAWAAGDTHHWWWPVSAPIGGYYWPPGISCDSTLASFIQAFELQGYEVCDNEMLEPGFEKVAMYVGPDGVPTHAARQLESGAWTSKLGKLEDIEHSALAALEGEAYGTVAQILKRQR
jgi:hypothetical protein